MRAGIPLPIVRKMVWEPEREEPAPTSRRPVVAASRRRRRAKTPGNSASIDSAARSRATRGDVATAGGDAPPFRAAAFQWGTPGLTWDAMVTTRIDCRSGSADGTFVGGPRESARWRAYGAVVGALSQQVVWGALAIHPVILRDDDADLGLADQLCADLGRLQVRRLDGDVVAPLVLRLDMGLDVDPCKQLLVRLHRAVTDLEHGTALHGSSRYSALRALGATRAYLHRVRLACARACARWSWYRDLRFEHMARRWDAEYEYKLKLNTPGGVLGVERSTLRQADKPIRPDEWARWVPGFLHRYLRSARRCGRVVVAIIDSAHLMNPAQVNGLGVLARTASDLGHELVVVPVGRRALEVSIQANEHLRGAVAFTTVGRSRGDDFANDVWFWARARGLRLHADVAPWLVEIGATEPVDWAEMTRLLERSAALVDRSPIRARDLDPVVGSRLRTVVARNRAVAPPAVTRTDRRTEPRQPLPARTAPRRPGVITSGSQWGWSSPDRDSAASWGKPPQPPAPVISLEEYRSRRAWTPPDLA